MNIESLLPLLTKSSNPQASAILSAAMGGDKNKILESLIGKDAKNNELLNMLSLMQQQQKKSSSTPNGLKAIYNFAPKDILGIMVKYFNK